MPTKKNHDLLDLRQPADKKASKPLMEKRRRARINHSLAQLKALVVDPNTTERSRQVKLEKADILELTVRHLYEIKRRQRTTSMLGSRPPKKKFEIGYAECVREVELFLSNLVGPQSPGVDAELQRRLKDHLNKRLEDFKSVEPLEASSPKELDEEPSSSLSSSSPPDDVLLLPAEDLDETDSSDSSVLNRMLKYYGEDKSSSAGLEDSQEENLLLKRLRKYQKSNEEESGHAFSCQSVTSTTGTRLAEAQSDNVHLETAAKSFLKKERPSAEMPECSEPPPVFRNELNVSSLKRKQPSSSLSLQPNKKRTAHNSPPDKLSALQTNRNEESASAHLSPSVDPIPLVPRQLANGDWALVLPSGLVPGQRDETHPFSAFRLVVPSSDTDGPRHRLDLSPLSSTVSDMSAEDYYSMSDGDPAERTDHSAPDSTQIVWRPW